MFNMLYSMTSTMWTRKINKLSDWLEVLRKSFNRRYKAHLHKTLIVLPIHVLPEKTFPFEPDISKDVPIRKLGNTGLDIGPDQSLLPEKRRKRKPSIFAYAVKYNGASTRIRM